MNKISSFSLSRLLKLLLKFLSKLVSRWSCGQCSVCSSSSTFITWSGTRHIMPILVKRCFSSCLFEKKKLSNRRRLRRGKFNPQCPEIFLDELFCNVNHVAGKTWILEDKVRYNRSGKGAR
ncbi:hypothetical protein PI124_g1758 [Phytophthora idaei]|nr:hypothetical protein PI125_g3987 [Phytophthora idaei]KAG3166127.1 hypothetical protein PI126_g4310 [Phytophthora idaei]KAG3253675.1 hypothetical protein PI124_g1758 [Phytophthora idaei]